MPNPEIVRAAWQIGELAYKLRNLQKKTRIDWLRSRTTHIKHLIECHRRFGKSTLILVLLTESCIKNPGFRAGYYAPVKEGLKDYIEPIITKVFDDCPVDLRPILDSSLTLTFPNGSQIIFRGSNNKQHRFRRGNDLNEAAIDEARDVDELENLIDSVILPSLFTGTGRLLIGSTPADTEDHELKAYRDAAEKEGWLTRYTMYDSNHYDPIDFPLAKIEKWKSETKDPIAWLREYEVKWVKDPSKVAIPEWVDAAGIAVIQHNEFFQFYHKYAALDSGVTDKTAGLLAYYDFNQAKLIVEDEFVLHGSEVRTDRIAELLKTKERALDYQIIHDRKDEKYKLLEMKDKVYRRVADNNNLILVNDLNSLYQLDFFPTHKDELAAMINMVREWVRTDRILVHPRCTELIGCLNNAIWDKKREKLAKSKVFGHFDAFMALVYLVRNIDVQTNPVPKFFGKSWATHAIPKIEQHPQTAAYELARIFNVKTDADRSRSDFVRGIT